MPSSISTCGDNENHRPYDRLRDLVGCMGRLSRPLLKSESDYYSLVEFAFGKNISITDPDIVLLPVTSFHSEREATSLWEKVEETLVSRGLGPSNTWPDIDGIFAELALNAVQHSMSEYGCTATLECTITKSETVFIVGIADAGIGILPSLRRNPEFTSITTDEDAISSATELGASGTTEQRGIGLHFVVERVRAYSGELVIVSGSGMLLIMGGQGLILKNFTPATSLRYSGTAVMAALPIPAL